MSDSPGPKPDAPIEGPTVLVSNRQDDVDVDERALAELAERTLVGEGYTGQELSLSFVDLGEMTALHERYMHEQGPTDVLSFPLGEDGLIGDVVICPAYAAADVPDVQAELRLLVVHGVLHLLGYDHEEEDERRVMWRTQEAYSGVPSP
jgi:probable rRNA maturation factor